MSPTSYQTALSRDLCNQPPFGLSEVKLYSIFICLSRALE